MESRVYFYSTLISYTLFLLIYICILLILITSLSLSPSLKSWGATIVSQSRRRSLLFGESQLLFQEISNLFSLMDHKESNAAWLSVPQFGDWDHKGVIPDYSMDFTKIREMRKQNKMDPSSRASIGNEEDLISSTTTSSSTSARSDHLRTYHDNVSPPGRRSFFRYFNCCVKA